MDINALTDVFKVTTIKIHRSDFIKLVENNFFFYCENILEIKIIKKILFLELKFFSYINMVTLPYIKPLTDPVLASCNITRIIVHNRA